MASPCFDSGKLLWPAYCKMKLPGHWGAKWLFLFPLLFLTLPLLPNVFSLTSSCRNARDTGIACRVRKEGGLLREAGADGGWDPGGQEDGEMMKALSTQLSHSSLKALKFKNCTGLQGSS